VVRDVRGQVGNAVRVAELVVVPCHNLEQVVAQAEGQRQVDGARGWVAQEVGRHQLLVANGQEVAHFFALGGLREGLVDGFYRRALFELDDEVDHRHGRGRHAHGKAGELALQLGDDLVPSLIRNFYCRLKSFNSCRGSRHDASARRDGITTRRHQRHRRRRVGPRRG
jgi:hypothetical protein